MKDAPYQQTIEGVHDFFVQYDFEIEILSKRNPLPNCWSHSISSKKYPYCTTNGKGDCKEASIASSYGEFIERFATRFFFMDYGLQKKEAEPFFCNDEIQINIKDKNRAIRKQKYDSRLLTPELLKFYDPNSQLQECHFLDNNYDEKDRGILAIPFYQLDDKEDEQNVKVYFPVALLNTLYVSNGMAAGNSRFECINQALSEIFERYVKFTVIAEGRPLPDINKNIIKKIPGIIDQIEVLEANGYQVRIKDASLGGLFPVICVLLLCPDGGAFASFGSSCRLEVALKRAITEMIQGRELSQLQGFEPPVIDVERFSNPQNLESHFINSEGDLSWQMFQENVDLKCDLAAWDFSGNSEEEFHHLQKILKGNQAVAYIEEFDQFPLYACRIIVPGMSEVYPVEDLLENNCNNGSWLRPLLLKLPSMKEKKLRQFLHKLDMTEFPAETQISHIIGIPFSEQSSWSSLLLGELRAMTSLALLSKIGNLDNDSEILNDTLQWCQWAKEYTEERKSRVYHLLTILLFIILHGENREDYKSALQHNFTNKEQQIAENILIGKTRFWGLDFASNWQEISAEYQTVISGFNILRKIMDK